MKRMINVGQEQLELTKELDPIKVVSSVMKMHPTLANFYVQPPCWDYVQSFEV